MIHRFSGAYIAGTLTLLALAMVGLLWPLDRWFVTYEEHDDPLTAAVGALFYDGTSAGAYFGPLGESDSLLLRLDRPPNAADYIKRTLDVGAVVHTAATVDSNAVLQTFSTSGWLVALRDHFTDSDLMRNVGHVAVLGLTVSRDSAVVYGAGGWAGYGLIVTRTEHGRWRVARLKELWIE